MPLLRFVLLIVLVFMFLTVLRGLRIFLAAFLGKPAPGSRPPAPRDGEMIRDPVCGTWVDRRLALPARREGQVVPVCSEKCRAALEALPAQASDPEARAR
jgi:YHS domain-containing protein